MDKNNTGGGVAWFAHIGGFASGVLAGFVLKYWESEDSRDVEYERIVRC